LLEKIDCTSKVRISKDWFSTFLFSSLPKLAIQMEIQLKLQLEVFREKKWPNSVKQLISN
jgi:hypothetical protein